MLQELAQKCGCFGITRARTRWTTYFGAGKRTSDRRYRVIVQLVVFLWRTVPIAYVWFVPNLPFPICGFLFPVLFTAMLSPAIDQLIPFSVVVRWVSPAGADVFLTWKIVTIWIR